MSGSRALAATIISLIPASIRSSLRTVDRRVLAMIEQASPVGASMLGFWDVEDLSGLQTAE